MIIRTLLITTCLALARPILAIEAAISYATFQSPEQAYLELYLRLGGSGITFSAIGDKEVQATAIIQVKFYREDQIVLEDRFQLSSPPGDRPVDFIALQRYPLPPGGYDLVVKVSDAEDPGNTQSYRAGPELTLTRDAVAQSDINLLANLEPSAQTGVLVRNGFLMEPLPGRFYGPEANRLFFYHEIYHTDRFIGRDFVLTYAIESLQNGRNHRQFEIFRRQSPAAVIPLQGQLDISKLPSGLYQLAIEIRDAKKTLISRKTAFFQRSNPGLWQQEEWLAAFEAGASFVGRLDGASLAYSLRALNPRLPAADMESVNYMLKTKDLKAQQAYLLTYWASQGPEDPERSYRDYMDIARAVDRQFHSGFRYGFETDRGYIYLKYGRPTEIDDRENEPAAPPYEIWTYDHLPATRQNNVRFIFYNPSLAPGDYLLLHSTARGELQQPHWQRILYKNAPNEMEGNDFLEGTEMIDNFHRRSRRIFGEN